MSISHRDDRGRSSFWAEGPTELARAIRALEARRELYEERLLGPCEEPRRHRLRRAIDLLERRIADLSEARRSSLF